VLLAADNDFCTKAARHESPGIISNNGSRPNHRMQKNFDLFNSKATTTTAATTAATTTLLLQRLDLSDIENDERRHQNAA